MPSSSAEFLFVFATKLWWRILPHKSIKSQGIFAFNSCAGVSPALRDLLPRQKPTPAPLGRLLLFNAFHSSLWHFMTNGSRCQRLPLACCSLVAMEPTRWTFEPLTIALFFGAAWRVADVAGSAFQIQAALQAAVAAVKQPTKPSQALHPQTPEQNDTLSVTRSDWGWRMAKRTFCPGSQRCWMCQALL